MKRMRSATIQSSSCILLTARDLDGGDRLGEVVGDAALHECKDRAEALIQDEAEVVLLLPRCPQPPVRRPMLRVSGVELNVRFDYRLQYAHEEPRFG